MSTQLIKATRHDAAEYPVNLTNVRRWHVDDSTRGYILSPATDAHEQAQRIINDDRFLPAYKRTEIDKIFTAAREEIESRAAYELKEFEAARPKLESAARPMQSPPAEEAAQLLYTRDLLMGSIRTLPQLTERWKRAITDGDKITARAINDNLSALLEKPGFKDVAHAGVQGLIEQTATLLETPEQTAARLELKALESRRQAVLIARTEALGQVASGFSIGQDGTITAAAFVQARQFTAQALRG